MSTRQFSRVKFEVKATVSAGDRRFSGTVENLSMSGMFLLTDQRLPDQEAVIISIRLSGSKPAITVNMKGRVSRLNDDGIGFLFDAIDIDSYTHLKNIIAYNLDSAETVTEEIHHAIDRRLSEATPDKP